MHLLPPMRFRFTDPDDVAAYGDRWWVWDEAAALRLRGRDLIAVEEQTGVPLRAAIRLSREDAAIGNLVVMWTALHLGGSTVKWADFDPIPYATDWERVPEEPAPGPFDSGEAPLTEPSASSTEPATESATSSPA